MAVTRGLPVTKDSKLSYVGYSHIHYYTEPCKHGKGGAHPVFMGGTHPVFKAGALPVFQVGTHPVFKEGAHPVSKGGSHPVFKGGTQPVFNLFMPRYWKSRSKNRSF